MPSPIRPLFSTVIVLLFSLFSISSADEIVWRKKIDAIPPSYISLSSAGVGASIHGNKVVVWNTLTGDAIRTIEIPVSFNTAFVFLRSDGKKLYVITHRTGVGLVLRWDVESGIKEEEYTIPKPYSQYSYILEKVSATFAGDGAKFAIGTYSPGYAGGNYDLEDGLTLLFDCYSNKIISLDNGQNLGLGFSTSGNYLYYKTLFRGISHNVESSRIEARGFYLIPIEKSLYYTSSIDGPFLHSPDDEYVIAGNTIMDFPPSKILGQVSQKYSTRDRFLSTYQILKFSFDSKQFARIINLPKDTAEYIFSDSVQQSNYALSPDLQYMATIGQDSVITMRKMPQNLMPFSVRAGFTVADTVVLKDTIYFQNATIPFSSKFRYNWDFGDSGKDTAIHGRHSFQTSGSFIVKLIVYDTVSKQSDTIEKSIFVRPVSKQILWLTNIAKSVTSLSFSSDNKQICAGGEQGRVAILQTAGGSTTASKLTAKSPVTYCNFINNDRDIITLNNFIEYGNKTSTTGYADHFHQTLSLWNTVSDSIRYITDRIIDPPLCGYTIFDLQKYSYQPIVTPDRKMFMHGFYSIYGFGNTTKLPFEYNRIGNIIYYNAAKDSLWYNTYEYNGIAKEEFHWGFSPGIYSLSATMDGKYAVSLEVKDSVEEYNGICGVWLNSIRGYLTLRETGKYRTVLRRIQDNSAWARCSPDGYHVLAQKTGLWNMWDSVNVQPTPIPAANFSYLPDGIHGIVVLNTGDTAVGIINTQTLKYVYYFYGYPEKINCAEVSPDGKYLATGSVHGNVALWRIPDTLKSQRVLNFALPLTIRNTVKIGDTLHFYNTSLPANENLRWEWDFGNGTTSQERAPFAIYSQHGQYTVKLRAYRQSEFLGEIVKEKYIVVGDISGVDKAESLSISIEPNPADGNLTMQFPAPVAGNYTIIITDIFGREVMTMNREISDVGRQIFGVSTTSLVNGMYFVRIAHGNAVSFGRFIVAR